MKLNHNYSSRFRILKGGKISLVVSALLGSATLSFAAPSGGVVTSGSATISQSGNTTNINQSTSKASINWQKFGIKADEVVNFNQPNKNSITLNRVIGNERSIIDGALNANGQVWILNSNGVLFSKNASINTSGLLATTKDISDTNFQKGNYTFSGDSTESIINQGTIKVKNNGYVIFASNEAKNDGVIEAIKGRVQLTGADEYTINLNGNSLIDLSVDKGTLDALVENSGTILADGGEIYLTTHAVDELLRGVVNNTGIIEANSLDGISGHVELYAHGGTANIDGTIKAKGGFVETSGKELSVASSTKVEASKWLLDPTNMIIESTGGSDITGASVSATAIESNLATTDIELLADNDITVNEDITWGEATKLTLTAGDEIYVNATIENTNATNGGVYFNAANNSSKVIFNTNGKVIINNVNQLQWMNTALNGNYELGSNIDASITSTWNSNGSGGFYGFDPIGDSSNIFRGNLDGKGYTIDGLYINRASKLYLGLIGYTHGYDKLISNIGLTNINFIGNDNVGGLVGYAFPISIEDSYVTGTINGNRNIGALIGYANGPITITDSYASVNLTGNNGVGGLLGYKDSTSNLSISDSYTTGSINGNSIVGGLLGYVGSVSTISNSYSTATVFGSGDYIGGLVGEVSASSPGLYMSNSYASGDITGNDKVGGLVGSADNGQINNSYSAGNITGNNYVGGLVGYVYNTTINNSYFSGDITGNNRVGGLVGIYQGYRTISNSYASGAITGVSNVGGVVGILGSNASISNSYWDRDSTGQTLGVGDGDTIGATGIYSSTNTINAFDKATYAGFDFTNDWIIYEGHTRPLLRTFMTELTVKANDVTRTYDGTTFTPSSTGVTYSIPTYDSSLVNGTLAYTSSGDLKNAGTATINVDGLYSSQQGYIINYDTGTLTTNKKDITVTANSKTTTYDGTIQTSSGFTASGLVSGETVAVLDGVTGDSASGKNAGTYNTNLSGTDENYNLTFQNGSLVINKRALSLEASKEYDGTADLTGFVSFGNLVGNETLEYADATANSKKSGNDNFISNITLKDGENGGLASNYELPSLLANSSNNSVTIGAKPDLTTVITPIANKTVLTNKDIDTLVKNDIDIKTILQQVNNNEFSLIPGIVMKVLNGGINLPFGSKQEFNLDNNKKEEENTI